MDEVNIGNMVTFVDPKGQRHNALVTEVWGPSDSKPSINLVMVDPDSKKEDQYGRQIWRETSITHKSSQGAPGFYWEFMEVKKA